MFNFLVTTSESNDQLISLKRHFNIHLIQSGAILFFINQEDAFFVYEVTSIFKMITKSSNRFSNDFKESYRSGVSYSSFAFFAVSCLHEPIPTCEGVDIHVEAIKTERP